MPRVKQSKRTPKDRGLVPVMVELLPPTVEKLDEEAQREGRRRGPMVRRIIEQHLAANPLEPVSH